MSDLPPQVPQDKIRLYCVGIFFYRDLDFNPDRLGKYMSGHAIAEEARKQGLTCTLSPTGHIDFVSYTPKMDDPMRHPPSSAPKPFPYYGKELSLKEVLKKVSDPPQTSLILQYTCDGPTPWVDLQTSPQFGKNGFLGGSFIRVRLISIFDASLVGDTDSLKSLGRSMLK